MGESRDPGLKIIRELLSNYYSKVDLILPENYMLREFAFQPFNSRSYVRHLSFQSLASLRDFLREKTPKQAYYSTAIYRDPAAERMEDKGWLGSEIMFDIDVDHIKGCNPTCVDEDGVCLINDTCIELGKEHLFRLIDVLVNDFGFNRSELLIYFTGNRGFHTVVQTKDEDWLTLGSGGRRELIDYVRGVGLNLKLLMPRGKGVVPTPPTPSDGGWRGRLGRLGVGIDELVRDNEVLSRASVEVDELVTQDISRLVRIPKSINGKSGLPSVILRNDSEISSFELRVGISPFKGYALIRPSVSTGELEVLGVKVRLTRDVLMKVELPVALFLSLNELASIVKLL